MGTIRAATFATLLATLLATSAAAQLPEPPADSVLAGITARGRLLVRYDIAAWHGGDALSAMQPAAGEITAAIARPLPSGRWEVLYGRLDPARDTFFVTWRATQADADSQFMAARVPVPEPLTGVERQMAVAIQVATVDFGAVSRPYNSYVIPAADGDWWVFFMPAQTDPRVFPHGGDARYRITAAGVIVSKDRLHRAILDRAAPPNAVAMVHTSVDSLPCETDVFMVLRRFPRLPEIVATRNFLFQVAIDGSITWTRTGTPTAAAPPPTAAAPARVPVWTPVIDSVGRIPRIMSPGYTAWRDTTTGWRISLERTVDVNAEPNSFEQARRPVLLDDGRLLVSQRLPAAVSLYDTDGRFVRSIGREGPGAEDYRGDIAVGAWHDTVIVHDVISARALLYSTDGRFLRSFPTDIHSSEIAVDSRGRLRVAEHFGFAPNTRTRWLYFSLRGARVDSLAAPPMTQPKVWRMVSGTRNMIMQIPFVAAPHMAFLADGTLIYGIGDRFEFVQTRTGRDTVRLFGRTNVTADSVGRAFGDSTFASLVRGMPGLDSVAHRADIPAILPLWNDVTVDNHGFIWVSVGERPKKTLYFAIFSPDGRYLGAAPAWFDNFFGLSWNGDRAAWMGYDKDHRPVVRVYRIDRRGM